MENNVLQMENFAKESYEFLFSKIIFGGEIKFFNETYYDDDVLRSSFELAELKKKKQLVLGLAHYILFSFANC